jgi:hypothetical protein
VTTVAAVHGGRTYGLGRRIQHDERSRAYPAAMARVKTTIHRHDGPVLDQGQLGSCTGNAAAQALNFEVMRRPADRRLLTEDDAVSYYSWATHHDAAPGFYPPNDTGSSGLAVARALKHGGLISSYRHAFGITHLVGAIPVAPVLIGIPWHEGMFEPDRDGYVSVVGPVVGGHELVVYGVDVQRACVHVLNSWGESWGVKDDAAGIAGGTCRMSYSTLSTLLADQGDATVLVL